MCPEHVLHQLQLLPWSSLPRTPCHCGSECQVEHHLLLEHHEQSVKAHPATFHHWYHTEQLHLPQLLLLLAQPLAHRHGCCDSHQRSALHLEKHAGLRLEGGSQNRESLQGFHPMLSLVQVQRGDQMLLQPKLRQVHRYLLMRQAKHHRPHLHLGDE